MKRSIKTKLMGLLLLAVVALVIMGLMGTLGLIKISGDQALQQQMDSNAVQAQKIVIELLDLRIQLREALVNANDVDVRTNAVKNLKQIDENLNELIPPLRDTLVREESMERFEELETLHYYLLNNARPEYYEMALAGDAPGMQAWLGKYIGDALHFQDLCEEFSALELELSEEFSAQNSNLANVLAACSLLVLVVTCAALVVLGLRLVGKISKPLQKMAYASERMALGDVHVDVSVKSDDELAVLSEAFGSMIKSMAAQAEVLHSVALGDYTVDTKPRSNQDLLGQSIKRVVDTGNELMSEISIASNMVSTGANQVAQIAQNLSDSSSSQMSNMHYFETSLNDVMQGARDHAERAMGSIDAADKLCQMIEQSNEDMHSILAAMASIDSSTVKVADIIRVIEDIALQTKILSLNAAVEAARAGQYGKGFGVVAEEVRNLAAKSAEAVGKISTLIENSRQRVNDGNNIVGATNARIEEMKEYILQSYQLFKEISDYPVHRREAVEAAERDLQRISKVVEDNFASAEQAAATSEELSGQAASLRELIYRFKVKSDTSLFQQVGAPYDEQSPVPVQEQVETALQDIPWEETKFTLSYEQQPDNKYD